MEKIGFFETLNEGRIEKSSTKLRTFIAAMGGILIAIASVIMESVTLGDSLPIVAMLLGYAGTEKMIKDSIEKKNKPEIYKQ